MSLTPRYWWFQLPLLLLALRFALQLLTWPLHPLTHGPLINLVTLQCLNFQVAALGAISNIVVDFMVQKTTFIKCGGLKQLVELSKSMDSTIRTNAVCALRNLMFLVSERCKEVILLELTQSTLTSLVCGTYHANCLYYGFIVCSLQY